MKDAKQKDKAAILTRFGLNEHEIVLGDGGTITILEVVRHVPLRRCVCRATWQGQPVYVKLFFGNKAPYYALRDVKGAEALQKAGLLTPKLLYQGDLAQNLATAIVYEEIVAASSAEDAWDNADETARLTLAVRLVETIAAHHDAGLLQTDLYLKNFLVEGEAIYSIDGDGVRTYSGLSLDQALDNLSQLLSKFEVMFLALHLPALLRGYVGKRSMPEPLDLHDMQARVDAARWRATHAYADKKIFRQCTDVDVLKTGKVFSAIRSCYAETPVPTAPVELDAYFNAENIIKNGNTCTVTLAQVGGKKLVIKRYNIKSFWHGVGRALRQTRAATSWSNAHRLQLLDVETAHPVALVETRVFGLKGKAYFLAEYIDAPDMTAFFMQTSDKALRAKAVRQAVELLYRLYLLKISHGDMKATNIKVLADGKPSLIDLDSMQQYQQGSSALKSHVRDIKRFMRNWKEQPSLYNAFVKAFKVVYADHAPLQAAQILE